VLWEWIGACLNLTARICRHLRLMPEEFVGTTRSFKHHCVISWRKIPLCGRPRKEPCSGSDDARPDLSLAPCSIASRPLRAAALGLRPVLTPISARREQRAWAGTKSGLQAKQKAHFWLANIQRLKNEETGASIEPKNMDQRV
jgi:hypothetical protein